MTTAKILFRVRPRLEGIAASALLISLLLTAMRASDPVADRDPLYNPALKVELGPERVVAPGAGWPYLFQAREGTTVVFGHVRWIPKQPHPIVFTTRSFDGRNTWQ